MVTIATWKLIADVLLSLSLFYLCFRIIKVPRHTSTHELQGLEQSLKRLIQEAEQSSRGLNDQLIKRQSDLEKLLFDVGSVESRLNKAIDRSEEQKRSIDRMATQSERMATERSLQGDSMSGARSAPIASREDVSLQADSAYQATPEPPSFKMLKEQIEQEDSDSEQRSWGSVNIYGEPIESPPTRKPKPQKSSAGLSSKIEKQAVTAYGQTKSDIKQDLRKIYELAEDMLRAGEDMHVVAATTKLPMTDVRRLTRMILSEVTPAEKETIETEVVREEPPQREEDEDSQLISDSDPRLGALAGMKRQVQVL